MLRGRDYTSADRSGAAEYASVEMLRPYATRAQHDTPQGFCYGSNDVCAGLQVRPRGGRKVRQEILSSLPQGSVQNRRAICFDFRCVGVRVLAVALVRPYCDVESLLSW